MKKIYIIIVLSVLFYEINAQDEIAKEVHHGILFSPRIDFSDGFAGKTRGFGLEAGYYYLKQVTKKGVLSFGVRFAYTQSESELNNLISRYDFSFFTDSIYTTRSGELEYENFAISIPVKYRYQLKQNQPIFLLVGVNPYLNLWNKSIWKYDEIVKNRLTEINVSEKKNQEQELVQGFFGRDIILLGIGYKKDRLMYDIYFSAGSIGFGDEFLGGRDKLSIVLNVYYKLNKTE